MMARGRCAGSRTRSSVGRYHSLCTRRLPERFRVHAEIDGMAMAISDPEALQTGLQFHPESILTLHGDRILQNVLEDAREARAYSSPSKLLPNSHIWLQHRK